MPGGYRNKNKLLFKPQKMTRCLPAGHAPHFFPNFPKKEPGQLQPNLWQQFSQSNQNKYGQECCALVNTLKQVLFIKKN